jgi:hypothetical protein
MFIKSLRLGSITAMMLFAATAWGTPSTLEGTVKDVNSQPLKGADVRIEATKGAKLAQVVKTDARGHYISGSLPEGNYRVTLLFNGVVKATINNAGVKGGKSAKLDFALKSFSVGGKPAKRSTHMVYMPAETGSHLGGRWVEVDDTGNPVGTSGADNVSRGGNDMLRNVQQTSVPMPPTGGH